MRLLLSVFIIALLASNTAAAPMSSYPAKPTPVAGDKVLITDSQDANKTKTATIGSFPGNSPAWLPSTGPTADNQVIQATGNGTSAWTDIIDGLINDAGTGTDDLLSAAEINARIAAGGGGSAQSITISTSLPTGGADNDIWYVVLP